MYENKTVIGPHNSYLDLATKTFVVTQQPSRQVAGQASQWLPLYQSQPLCNVLRIRVVSFFVSSISLFSPGSTCQSVELVRASFLTPLPRHVASRARIRTESRYRLCPNTCRCCCQIPWHGHQQAPRSEKNGDDRRGRSMHDAHCTRGKHLTPIQHSN
jgi:hypothetical protein